MLIGGSSDDEDEDDDDDDEEAEEAKAAAGSKRKAGEEESEDAEDEEGAKKVSARKPKAVEEEESESEEESEGMDDEAMFRMDTHIGAHLKLVMEQRRNVREAKAALAALRFRALALLEAFAKKVGGCRVWMLVCALRSVLGWVGCRRWGCLWQHWWPLRTPHVGGCAVS